MDRSTSWRLILIGLARALIEAAVLVTLYFTLPLDGFVAPPVVVISAAGALLIAVSTWQIMGITRARHPGVRAIEALAVVAPTYLLLFATTYYFLAAADPSSFTGDALSRVDALYFTVTIFSTVGFGDISAVSEVARVLVTVQMILNLLILGSGIRLLTFAVRRGRESQEQSPAGAGSGAAG